jgi:DNA (cytosine-5)-methyltransferase 1
MVKPVCIGSFSGCGGSSLGYKQAGFDVRVALEIDNIAADVYEQNHAGVVMIRRDIRSVDGAMLLDHANVRRGELHMWEGSPPCSKFSVAGKREKAWNKITATDSDEVKLRNVEDLFVDWIRLLDEMQPMTAVAENVPGLAMGVAKGKLVQFVRAIERVGYTTQVWVLHAERFGVPQARHRLFIACVRNDLNASTLKKPVSTTPAQPYGPVIADLPTITWFNPNVSEAAPSDHYAPSITSCKIYEYWKQMQVGGSHPQRFSMRRPPLNKPCSTITSFDGNFCAAGVCHPHEPRRFSIAEMRRIFGYPDNFIFNTSYKNAIGRLGNSVPPPLARVVATTMMNVLAHNNLVDTTTTTND